MVLRARAPSFAKRRAALATLCACVAVAGCHKTPGTDNEVVASSKAPEPILGMDTRVHALGELGRGRDYAMSVESSKDCPMEPPFSPKHGNAKVGIEVSIEGSTDREVPVNAFYATLYDARGDSYTATLAGCEPALPSLRITSGKSAHGFITFEVPKGSDKLELRYAPVVIGPGVEELKFAIRR